MEFAGREYIYLPQKKIDKLNGYKSEDKKEGEEKENENVNPLNLEKKEEEKKEEEKKEEEKDAPPPPLNPKEKSKEDQEEENLNEILGDDKIEIKDEEISCDSNSCCNISNEHLNDKYSNAGSYEDNLSCDLSDNQFNYKKEEKEENFVQETDINIFSVDYNQILNKDFSLKENPIRCKKCSAILNIYSNLNLIENDEYKWECEFCKQINIINTKKILFKKLI